MTGKRKERLVRKRVCLAFPENLIKEPILSMRAKRFKVAFNIRSSTVTTEMALVAIEIDGEQREVEKTIGWLKNKSVTVEPIEKNVFE